MFVLHVITIVTCKESHQSKLISLGLTYRVYHKNVGKLLLGSKETLKSVWNCDKIVTKII